MEPRDATHDTWVAPLVQLGPVGIRQDEGVTTELLRAVHTLPAHAATAPAAHWALSRALHV